LAGFLWKVIGHGDWERSQFIYLTRRSTILLDQSRSPFSYQKERSPFAREKVVKGDRPARCQKERSPVAREKVVKGDRAFDAKRSIARRQ